MTLNALYDSVDIILRTKGVFNMRKSAFIIIIAMIFVFSACQKVDELPISLPAATLNTIDGKTVETTAERSEMISVLPTIEPTAATSSAAKPTFTVEPIPTAQPTVMLTEKPTERPTAKPTQAPALSPTKPPLPVMTTEPTPQQTPEPIEEPTPQLTPEPTNDITPVSSSYINAAMTEINRLREENGVAPATLSGSISSSCQNHAVKMAESGSAFHASGVYMFEAVGRASNHMPGGTMGGSAANHVVQLQSAEVTKIGIGAVYCGDYVYYVVRGD